ncbi:hypothetical protein CR513_14779, partial [Mucuna pruriens]
DYELLQLLSKSILLGAFEHIQRLYGTKLEILKELLPYMVKPHKPRNLLVEFRKARRRSISSLLKDNLGKLHAYNLEIDRTFHRLLRNSRSSEVVNSSIINSSVFAFDFVSSSFVSNSTSSAFASDHANSVDFYFDLAQSYELKSGLIQLLPKFHGLVGEDPHKNLKEFHVMCSTMWSHGIPQDYIKMKAFPFSLDGVAKD